MSTPQKVALVTGASGFIGSCVVRALNERGIRARALLRSTSSTANLKDVPYDVARGDLSDAVSLNEAVKGVDYIFHLAGSVAARNRAEYFAHNADGTERLAQAAARSNPSLTRFVYVSSLAAGGPSTGLAPRCEADGDAPISDYGFSKREGEERLRKHAAGKYPFTIVRPPAVYGPRDKGVFEFVKMVKSGILPKFPAKTDTGEKYVSVVHVEDLVQGILDAGLRATDKEEIFYISGDGVYTWTQIFEQMAAVLGKKPLRIKLPKPLLVGIAGLYTGLGAALKKQFPLTLDKLKELEPDFWTCSNERAKRKIGFQPRFDLQEGIKNTVQWYLDNDWL